MRRSAFLSLLAAGIVALAGVAPAETGSPPQRTRALTVYGNDPCPKGEGDDIVVCAREPESERYRIPKRLRKTEEESDARSWTDRVPAVEEASRSQRPGSCTSVGAGGQTGCTQAMLRAWAAERRAIEAGETAVP
ncbi:MAG: hypothetical protein ABW173_01105 [Sphingomonas sp.]